MSEFDSKKYISLSKNFRNRTMMYWSCDWENININDIIEDYMTEDERIAVLGMASFHPSGFMREKALDELNKYNNQKVFPFIIIRNCDWILPIRKKAQNILNNMINIENIGSIIDNILLIYKIKENIDGMMKFYKYDYYKKNFLKKDERLFNDLNLKVKEIIECSNNRTVIKNILEESISSKETYVQQFALIKIIDMELLPTEEVLNRMAKIKNQITCVKAMKLILKKLNNEEVLDLKESLDKVNGYMAKVELIRSLENTGIFENIEVLKSYALSKYASVRDIARFYMKKHGFTDFISLYKDNLSHTEYRKEALLGLCETGTLDEINYILKYFKSAPSKIQKKILNRIIEFSESEFIEGYYNVFIEALESNKPSVVRLGKNCIMKKSELFDKDDLNNKYNNCNNDYTKSAIAEILCHGNGWSSLLYGLRIIKDKNSLGYSIGLYYVERWISSKKLYFKIDKDTGKVSHYSLSKINRDTAEELSKLIEENGSLLKEDDRNIIRGLILNYKDRA